MIRTPYNAPAGFDWVVRLAKYEQSGNSILLQTSTASGKTITIRLNRILENVWRYTVFPEHLDLKTPSPLDKDLLSTSHPVTVRETGDRLIVEGPLSGVTIQKDPWHLGFFDSARQDILRENPGDVDGLGRPFVLPLGAVARDGIVSLITQSFYLHPDEALFGLGEKFTPLNKVGQKIDTWNLDALGSTSERSHKNIPLLLSTRGYGIYVHTGARISWEIGTQSRQSFTLSIEHSCFDVFVIVDPTLAGLLRRYTDLVGHSPVPPKWSFGLWVSSGGTYRDKKSMMELVTGLEDNRIPADVVHIDTWWMKWRKYCDFQWDRQAFPNVERFIEELHTRKLHICLWEHPYVSIESDLFELGRKRGFFAKRPDGSVYVIQYGLSLAPRPDGIVREADPADSWNAPVAIIDLTNPDAYRWFQDFHRPLLRMGIDVFKTDFGEDIPADAVFHNGNTGAVMHNLYPLLYNRAVFEVTEQEKGCGIVWSRSGTAGNQRYPVCWSGDPAADFESLACTIRGGLSAGLSGIPFWSNDVGGYRGKPSPELYTRWAQFGLLCSHSRMHGDSPREPWQFGDAVLDIVRRYVRLRYQLFPYIYSCALEASRFGIPVIRAMPLAFQDDINSYDKDFQFLLGPWLLIAPIYTKDNTRQVYLPAGEWINYWTLEHHSGPGVLNVSVPLDTLPMYVRSGAIIPMMNDAERIPSSRIDTMTLGLYPSLQSSYELFEDEGPSTFRLGKTAKGFELTINSTVERSWVLRLRELDKSPRVALRSQTGQVTAPRVAHNAQSKQTEIFIGPASVAFVNIDIN